MYTRRSSRGSVSKENDALKASNHFSLTPVGFKYGIPFQRDCLLTTAMEDVTEGEKRRGRRRMKLIDSITIRGCYEETKRLAYDRTAWRAFTI